MSLKDDFLEALRSVKKDFLKDYEGPEEPDKSPRAQEQAPVSPQTAAPTQEDPFRREDPLPQATAMGNDELHDLMHERNPMLDRFQPELHTPAEPGTPDPSDVSPFVTDAREENGYADSGDIFSAGAFQGQEESEVQGGRFTLETFDEGEEMGDERTVISKNTVIRGALQTDDSVRMFGQVLGDIDCRSNILVAGKVRGNTSAANAYIINAQVDGNLLCDDVINVTDDAWVLGNIRAQQADIDGKIKGNIEIRHSISIGSNSSVIGNISTDELEIRRGAFVNGQIMMYSPSRDVIDRFDQFDQ